MRQDVAGQSGGNRSPSSLPVHERFGIYRNDRRTGCGSCSRSLQGSKEAKSVHHLHRRNRRDRKAARRFRSDGRNELGRERADAEPAAGGDGRNGKQGRRAHASVHESRGCPRQGVATSRSVRPAHSHRPAQHAGAPRDLRETFVGHLVGGSAVEVLEAVGDANARLLGR